MRSGRQAESRFWKKTAISTGIIALGCILLIEGIKWQIGPNLDAVSQLRAKGMVTELINQTIEEEFTGREYEENLFSVRTGEDGKIQMVQSNTSLINKMVSSFASSLQKKYNEQEAREVKLSYGSILGSKLLSQTDLGVNIRILPLSVASCDFETDFESQGINQTKYRIYITVESSIRVLRPFSSGDLKVRNKVLVAETVIVGEVPDSYVNVPENEILDAVN